MEFGLLVCFFDLEQKPGSVAGMLMLRRVLFVVVVDSFGFACYGFGIWTDFVDWMDTVGVFGWNKAERWSCDWGN
jgi:hypothetical protein